MSKSGTVIQLLQTRLEGAIRRRRENPSRADILILPALALALDACGGGGSQRPTPPPPPPPPPPPNAAPTIEIAGGGDEDSTAGGVTASFMIPENSPDAVEGAAGHIAGLITLSDADADDTHTVEADNEDFQVIDHEGAKWLTLKPGVSYDFEALESNTITVTVTVTDSGEPAESASAEVTLTVTDVNEEPSIDVRDGEEVPGHAGVISSLTIEENATRGDAPPLALIEVMDPDAADQPWLTGEDGVAATSVSDDRFAVILDPENGLWLHLAEGASLDHEADDEITVTVTFTDSAGNTASQDVTVMVTDVNEAPSAPVVVDADDLSVDENDAGASVSSVEVATDPEGDTGITYHVDDGRFEISSGRVLKLKDGMSLDHEAESSVTLNVTARDSDGNESEATTVTVAVNDVNESPNVTGTIANVTAEAGKTIDVEIDLTGLFSDPDAGDSAVRWELGDGPSWLGLEVEYVTENGQEKVIAHLRGEPPTTGADSSAAHKVTLTARDAGGAASDDISFYVIVDDGNDEVTGVNLLDGNGDAVFEAEVDENDASGVVFGEITVDDIDHPMHPNGMHQVTVNDRRFEIRVDDEGGWWLALKEGVSLDYEDEEGAVTVRVTAVDMNGEENDPRTAERTGEKYKGTSETVSFTVVINDLNDAPEAQTIGNWWVTVDDDLEADQVSEGSWLKFQLETEDDGDSFPAFKDPDGDTLTYAITRGPSWLEIDEDDGTITNADDAVPRRGRYPVTVTATDPDGESGTVSFYLNVALSGPANNYQDDNEEPSIREGSVPGYREGTNDVRVATFTVTDRDQDIPDHEFAISKVEIISVVNGADAADAIDLLDATLRDHDSDEDTPDRLLISEAAAGALDALTGNIVDSAYEGYAGAFRLSEPIKSGNTWTYHIYARDTEEHPFISTVSNINLNGDDNSRDEIEITVRVTDGVGATDERTIDIDIIDVNEAPRAPARNPGAFGLSSLDGDAATDELAVKQTETSKIVLYIKLFDVWSDDESSDDRKVNDIKDYDVDTSGSWIKVTHIGEWGDIREGQDGDENTDDDLDWNPTDTAPTDDAPGTDNRLIGSSGNPDDSEWVAIVEIDRTTRDNQGDVGSITLTARDNGDGSGSAATGSVTYEIRPSDLNVVIGDGAVRISGSPREDGTLRAHFNDNRDPDLGGSAEPALVLYSWYRVDNQGTADETDDTETLIAVTTGNEYSPTQSDVGDQIKVSVSYYEVFGRRITSDAGGQSVATGGLTGVASGTTGLEATGLGATLGGEAITSRDVSNTPDDGQAAFTIMVDTDTLRAEVNITDGDYLRTNTPDTTGVVFPGSRLDTKGSDSLITKWQWQVSDNGRGGWEDVDEPDPDTSTDVNEALQDNILTLANGNGKYYRVVVSYLENQGDTSANAPMEEVASQAIRIGNVDNNALPGSGPTGTVPTISGSANPGGTLIVNGSGISSVQWQMRAYNHTPDTESYWTDIPGATGTSLSLTSDHAGDVVRAVVTYESRDPNNPGATLVLLADRDGETAGVQSDVAVRGAVPPVRPVAVNTEDDPYWIETSVSGTGHARWKHWNKTDTSGQTVSYTGTVPLASLFQDTDTPGFLLRFTATGDTATGLDADERTGPGAGGTYEFANDHNLLVLELGDGKLTYVSDKLRDHDNAADGTADTDDDGLGNWLTLDITANDAFGAPVGNSATTAEVRLRINVAPTDIFFENPDTAGPDSSVDPGGRLVALRAYPELANTIGATSEFSDAADDTFTDITEDGGRINRVHLNENVRATGEEVLAVLDVQDENHVRHSFGTHNVTVDDDRFEITNTGNSVLRDMDAGGPDGSTWQLRLKPGATFDYEADDQDGDPFNRITEFKITLMATDGGGLSTPEPHPESDKYIYLASWLYQPITLTIRIINDPDDDLDRPTDENVPGLKDDESTDPSDEPPNDEREDGDDSDVDGGSQPPPPGMSLGGIIEDFIGNMDQGEADLLEDYLLTIDDGLDIA